jgi:hypothetical protein
MNKNAEITLIFQITKTRTAKIKLSGIPNTESALSNSQTFSKSILELEQ